MQIEFLRVFEIISKLGGQDCTKVYPYLEKAKKKFVAIDHETQEILLSKTNILLEQLQHNRKVFSEETPIEESIFVYVDVSSCVELLNYIIDVRTVVNECLDSNGKVRFSDLRRQHSTWFIDIIGEELRVTETLLERVASKYAFLFREVLPFNLIMKGPYLARTGGIILEGTVYSHQYFNIRAIAREDTRYVPKRARRAIHEITHSTIGYITDATPRQLTKLQQAFNEMRDKDRGIPIRIREARIIATKNKKLIDSPARFLFGGKRDETLAAENVIDALQEMRMLIPSWIVNDEMRIFIREEAMYWAENAVEPQILHEAHIILHEIKSADENGNQ